MYTFLWGSLLFSICMCAGMYTHTHTHTHTHTRGFPGDSDGKESTCNEGDLGLIPELGRFPRREKGYPLQYSGLENPMEQRSLVSYGPCSRKESDTTEPLSFSLSQTHTHTHTHTHTDIHTHIYIFNA